MPVTLKQFVKRLEESRIFNDDTLKNCIAPHTTLKNADELAFELVRQQKLTKFQVDQIYQGNAKSLVLGNYILMDKIKAGGMGQVFKARHRRMDRIVAIKLLHPGRANDASIARFEREVQAVSKFSHPNIVAAYDADYANGYHFLVMEHVEGSDLYEFIKKNGRLTVEQALNYILQAAKGLEAAHAKEIIHRDIKPGNLLLDKNGIVKVLDLGIARLAKEANSSKYPHQGNLTSMGVVMGTVEFMAPEQALDFHDADARADIYSLGCSLFYLLTGKSTYQGDTMLKTLVAHREQPIPSLRQILGDIPDQIETIFQKMVAKKMEDRYQTMAELIDAIEACGRALNLRLSTPLSVDSSANSIDWGQMRLLDENLFAPPTVPALESQTTKALPQENQQKYSLIAGAILGPLILLAFLVLSVKTKAGTLVITINEADAEVQVVDQAGKVEITRNGEKNPLTISVDPGKHRLNVSKEGFEFFTKDFVIESGGKEQIRAKLVPLDEKPTAKNTEIAPNVVPAQTVSHSAMARVKKPLAYESAEFDQWLKDVAGLPPEKQIEAVSRKLQELNPGFDGELLDFAGNETPKIENGVVTELEFAQDDISDISPLRALPGLQALLCYSKSGIGRLSDLSPLQGMNLKSLRCFSTRISDLSPLRGMKLTTLGCVVSYVSDLSPLEGMPLQTFNCHYTNVSDLTPLSKMPLTELTINRTDVADLSPLRGMQLETFSCDHTQVSDLSPLQDMNLVTLSVTPQNITNGIDVVRQMKTLMNIGVDGTPPIPSDEFWEKYDAGEFGRPTRTKPITDLNDPAFQQWITQVTAMPADMRLEAVSKKLVELNPKFDGKLTDFAGTGTPKIEYGSVTELGLNIENVIDISPVRALSRLRELHLYGDSHGENLLSDLSSLKGMNLVSLAIRSRNLRDLSPLIGMPLNSLNCPFCAITDLSPLKSLPLQRLILSDTKVEDLSPLAGMKLQELLLDGTRVSNLSPLRGMPLRHLRIDVTQVTDLTPLQGMSLTNLACRYTQVFDLSPLKGSPLTTLFIQGTLVSDLTPLSGMALNEIRFSPDKPMHGLEVIRQMQTLETIGDDEEGKVFPPTEFWKKYDAGDLYKLTQH